MAISAVHKDRLRQAEAAVYSVREAARLLGWDGAEQWIRREALPVTVDGRERVIWGDILQRMREQRPTTERPNPNPLPNRPNAQRAWDVSPAEALNRFLEE